MVITQSLASASTGIVQPETSSSSGSEYSAHHHSILLGLLGPTTNFSGSPGSALILSGGREQGVSIKDLWRGLGGNVGMGMKARHPALPGEYSQDTPGTCFYLCRGAVIGWGCLSLALGISPASSGSWFICGLGRSQNPGQLQETQTKEGQSSVSEAHMLRAGETLPPCPLWLRLHL